MFFQATNGRWQDRLSAEELALYDQTVDLRITQIAAGVVGVHALWTDRLRVTN